MKKILTSMMTILAVVVLAFTIAGCSKRNSVKKAFEKDGWTVTVVDGGNAAYKDAKVLTCQKMVNGVPQVATIACFGSAKKCKDGLGAAYSVFESTGAINGDCVLILGDADALNTFKKA